MEIHHDRIRRKLEDIAKALKRLERLMEMGRESFLSDEDSQDIARSRLLTAIEAALNICYHLAAKRLNCVPEDYAACFLTLGEASLIDSGLAERLSRMALFRNRLVHLYWDVDYEQVYDILLKDLGDLERFSAAVADIIE